MFKRSSCNFVKNVCWLFLGPPGVGKGTYAGRVSEQLGLVELSTGNQLRKEIREGTDIGKKIHSTMDAGKFVPDEMVIELVKNMLVDHHAEKKGGYILDGFPRNLAQAKLIESIPEIKLDHVINFRQPYEVIIAKLSSRKSCADCGMVYNYAKIDQAGIKMDPLVPRVDGVCDKCGSTEPLVTRVDDRFEVVKERLELYNEVTAPLEQYYDKKGILEHFDVLGGANTYLPKLIEQMEGIAKKIENKMDK